VWAYYDQGDAATRWFLRALVRAGVLRRISALDDAGVVRMPDSARVARYIVGDSLGRVLDRPKSTGSRYLATVLAADAQGRPRFDALVTLLGESHDVADVRPGASSELLIRSANAMTRYYPSRPETWILTYPIAHRSVISDIVKRFESRERVYYGWYDALEHRKGLSAETELMMANLGWELMDTARADFWVGRLLQEHPTNPWVPELWLSRYRDVPDDSAATVLRAFEPIFTASATPASQATDLALRLAERSGDEELGRRWRLRAGEQGDYWAIGSDRADWPRDSASLSALERRLLLQLAEENRDSLGTPTIWASAQLEAYMNWQRRLRIRTRLAAIQLLRGQVTTSMAMLDGIVREVDARPTCPVPETLRWRAEANRQLGNTAKAMDDLAYVASMGDWKSRASADSAATSLGVAYTPEAWGLAKRAASDRLRSCFIAFRDHRRTEGW
ncbi:MAG: hypothetical protein ACHQRK_03130, partial [Gemmatimonadales bacterium]